MKIVQMIVHSPVKPKSQQSHCIMFFLAVVSSQAAHLQLSRTASTCIDRRKH